MADEAGTPGPYHVVSVQVAGDPPLAYLVLLKGGKEVARHPMTVDEMPTVMANIAKVRLYMLGDAAKEDAAGPEVPAQINPRIALADEPTTGTVAMLTHHRGYGWVSFLLSEAEAEKLRGGLARILVQLRKARRGRRPH